MSTTETAAGRSWPALLVVLAVWAAIYLPGLGTLEIKGEEGRRILPAVTMLQTGNYIVPQVGSEPYFRKPPLVNWLVAASFQIFGVRNEWAARLPSTLCVLAVALAFVTVGRGSLGPSGSLVGALVWMTTFGMIEKGRLIEIEALYVSLCGLAVVCWLGWWQERRSPWLTWVVPWIFLGLGLLAKGPLHLLFFYAVVVGVLYQTRELPRLWNKAHAVGVVLMIAIFAAWAVPCLLMMEAGNVAHTWSRQFTGRLAGDDFNLRGWLMNIPRGLGYFLPWTIVLVFAGVVKFRTDRETQVIRGVLWGSALSFILVNLLPGSLARYTMPLLVPATWVVAMLITAETSPLPKWFKPRSPKALAPELRLAGIIAALVCIAISVYAFVVMPHLLKRAKVKNIGAEINGVLPAAQPLYAVDPDYQPFLFYVRDPIVYVSRVADVPADARYLLVEPKKEPDALKSTQWLPAQARPILRIKDYRKREVTILEVQPPE